MGVVGLGQHVRLCCVLVALVLGLPGLAAAQTPVVNPRTLVFTPSADHDTLLPDGRAMVDHYSFDVYSVGASQPFQRTDIGKPMPGGDGLIYYDFSAAVGAWPLPGGNYEARVAAIGPTGDGTSAPSNPFTFGTCAYALSATSASLPAAGGGTQVSVSTTTSCSWTATSNAAWIALGSTGGTGNGTVVATIAANASGTARVGTFAAAGQTFTVNQAGASASLPSAPASPSPAAGATSVSTTPTLTWSATGATSYTVRFGTVNPPPQAAAGLSTASYPAGTLSAGTTYYWQVIASNSSGATTGAVWSFTTAATAAPAAALPSPWRNADVGNVGLAGSASYSSGTYTVTGSGADIWGTADAFQYLYSPLTGDGQIVARMTGEQNTHQYAKAGIMLRESLAAGAAHVVLDVTPSGGVEFMTRAASGGSTSYLAGTTQAAPAWLKLVRSGTKVTASVSADGIAWRTVGSTTVAFATSAYVGPCVTSHSTSLRNTARFDNVAVTAGAAAGLPSPWVDQDVGSVGLSGSAAYASGRFTVTGSGADIWGTADAFHYVYQALAGDGQIVARMTGEQNTNGYAKAGVMVRAGLSAGAARVILDVVPSGAVEFMTRPSAGGNTTYLGGTTQIAPAWLRLVRTGSTIAASVSPDGITWRALGSTTLASSASVYVGLAVTSHDNAQRNTAAFDNVTVR